MLRGEELRPVHAFRFTRFAAGATTVHVASANGFGREGTNPLRPGS